MCQAENVSCSKTMLWTHMQSSGSCLPVFKNGAWLLYAAVGAFSTRMPSPTALNNLFSCISFLPLDIVKYKAWIQILIRLVFWALLCLSLGLLPSTLRFPGYRWGYLPVVLCQKLQKGLTQRWLLNLCQMLVLEIDHAKSVAFSLWSAISYRWSH